MADESPLLCPLCLEPRTALTAGGDLMPWSRSRYRCGCSTTTGPAPNERGDLISIKAPGMPTVRGLVVGVDRSDPHVETIRLLPDPFDED